MHVHLFIARPTERWLGFPYAVEGRWLTRDLRHQLLYLHCVVPTEQAEAILFWLRQKLRRSVCIVVTGDGRQVIEQRQPVNDPVQTAGSRTELLTQCPLLVPVLFESQMQPHNLGALWSAIFKRLGHRARLFLPHRRLYRVNGKLHVKEALHVLEREGLFLQYVVSPDALLHERLLIIAVVATPQCAAFLAELEQVVASQQFRGDQYTVLIAVVERATLEHLPPRVMVRDLFLVTRTPTLPVRFSYEVLFEPTTGSWKFSPTLLQQLMEERP